MTKQLFINKAIILIVMIVFSYSGFTQDTIYIKSNHDYILSDIIEVNIDNLKYRKFTNLDGPLYTIDKSTISKVVFSNGDIEEFNRVKSNKSISDLATVYVIRVKSKGAWRNKVKIFQDEKIIGELGVKSYLTWNIEPNKGEITIISKTEGTDELRINPKPGKKYYILVHTVAGWLKPRSKLEFIDENEAKNLLNKVKPGLKKYVD